MENLTLEEINQLILEAGAEVVAKTSEFRQINASNEGQYRITYDVDGEEVTNTIFILQNEDGSFRASVNTLLQKFRGVAQSGSALGLGPRGRGFESFYPDQ